MVAQLRPPQSGNKLQTLILAGLGLRLGRICWAGRQGSRGGGLERGRGGLRRRPLETGRAVKAAALDGNRLAVV